MAFHGLSTTEKQTARDMIRKACPVGSLVKFTEPQTEDEETRRFVVLEDRESRVLLRSSTPVFPDNPRAIEPTFVYDWLDVSRA